MLVSIVTPSFNQGRFIERTIQSVLEQDYPHIEFIVMDGGSTDETLEILKKYGKRIKWFSEKDEGQSDAINKGIRMAKGDVVAWLNSDDYYLPGIIKKVVEVFKKDPDITMVYGDGYRVDEFGEKQRPAGVEPFFDLWKLIHLYDFILQPSTFMRRDAIFSAGLVDSSLYYNLDWELWIRMAKTGKVVYMPEKLSVARVYPLAKTQSGGWPRWREIVSFSRRYGNYKYPPTVFLHIPKRFLRNNSGGFASPVQKTLSIGRWILYPLTKGRVSGFYQDGYIGRRGFISIPIINEAKYLNIMIEPLLPGNISLKINNDEIKRVTDGKDLHTVRIELKDITKKRDFLHLEFRADAVRTLPPTQLFPYSRRVSFRVKDMYYLTADGNAIRDHGFPNLVNNNEDIPAISG